MRLRQRRNVDLPQPLGPMMAVAERAGIWMSTFCTVALAAV